MNPIGLLALAGAGWYFLKGKGPASAAPPPQYPGQQPAGTVAPSSTIPIGQRMAAVLATKDPNAIRFEAGRLRQEGYPDQATQLETEAAKLDALAAAASKPAKPAPAPAKPQAAPPPVIQVPVIVPNVTTQPPPVTPVVVPPLQPPSVPTPVVVAVPQPNPAPPVTPTVPVELHPLPVLAKGQYLEYVKPPAPFDPRVQLWQNYLLAIGISVGKDGADGKFGTDTKGGTIQFQKQAGITADGIVGPQTLTAASHILPAA